jgi:hypothetical protein
MSTHIYEPPRQSAAGQLRDSVIILALVFVVLFGVTFVVQSTPAATGGEEPTPLTELPITAAERQQYERMIEQGVVDLEGVNAAVAANNARDDKYEINWLLLGLTVASILLYLTVVVRMSLKEYREVVRERFDTRMGDTR